MFYNFFSWLGAVYYTVVQLNLFVIIYIICGFFLIFYFLGCVSLALNYDYATIGNVRVFFWIIRDFFIFLV